MTVFIDPVIGAALVAGLLPILPGLPCPTCGGRSEFRDDMFGSSPCPDCTDGVWTPPDSPVTIGVTSARPEVGAHDGYIVCSVIPKGYVPDYEADDDDFYEASGRGLMTNDEWAHKFDDISNHNPPHPIVLSSMIGEGTLRKVKVHDWDHEPEDDPGIWLEGRPGHIIGLVLQDDSLAETDISSALPFLPGLFKLPGYREAERQAIERAAMWLARLNLTHLADDAAGDLPYGIQRRIEIARALCVDPVLLCLDEPAAGLNPRESAELNELLLYLCGELGIAILLIEHDMSVVMN